VLPQSVEDFFKSRLYKERRGVSAEKLKTYLEVMTMQIKHYIKKKNLREFLLEHGSFKALPLHQPSNPITTGSSRATTPMKKRDQKAEDKQEEKKDENKQEAMREK